MDEKTEFINEISKYEAELKQNIDGSLSDFELMNIEGRRRHRRTAEEIERKFKCTYPGCNKSYG